MNSRPLRVAILADVSVGYGTPQVIRMAESFARKFGAEVHIFEPDQSERLPIDIQDHIGRWPVFLKRVYSVGHPFTIEGKIEFLESVVEDLTRLEPDVLIMCALHRLTVLDRLPDRGQLNIFYCLEEIDRRYEYLFPLVRRCQVVIYPEENRRRVYLDRLGGAANLQTNLLLLNGNHPRTVVPAMERTPRLFYGGSFHRDLTFASYFLEEEILPLPIDIYGIIDGFSSIAPIQAKLNGARGASRYCGYFQTNDWFFKQLATYLYSIVIWNPDREDRLYACPNKLFDAIACGVPPICAPHPQCVEIIRRWKCGILMDDWTFASFKTSLHQAVKIAQSDYYCEMVENCHRAMKTELSWDRQFEGLAPHISKWVTGQRAPS